MCFLQQKTAYDMCISDWSSDVCSSDLCKGESVLAFVICRGDRPSGADAEKLTKELREHVGREIGALAKPDEIRFADNLPKTRSGKIMRRLLRAIAKGEEITQDISTLENPAIVKPIGSAHV